MKTLVLDYLEASAARFPDRTAFGDTEKAVNYRDFQQSVRQVGTALARAKGDCKVVAFYTDKSVDTVVGFLGSVYAGCAYTQINTRNPAARVADILSTVEPCLVVTDRAHADVWRALGLGVEPLLLEALLDTPADDALLRGIRAGMLDTDPLYINFTSGSTGRPKGVAVCHRSVVDFITCFTEIFQITERDVIANQAPFDFDVSVKDIYSALFTGAAVQIVPTAYFLNPVALMDFLCDREVSLLIWAVSALCFITSMNALDYRVPDRLRAILFSGEVMPIKHLNKLRRYLPQVQYVNLYGPTEITCNCSYYIVDRAFDDAESLPIGVPFPNERLLLLGEDDLEVTEPGGVGELCVSGTALALGYYRNPEKTAEVFVQNPNNRDYPERIYRTGDLVRIGEDGALYYVSRKDFQIKHMGHRVELGEIETRIGALERVDRACCLFDEKRDRILAVYTGEAETDAIVSGLQETLPSFMIPQSFHRIDAFPLNKNGKIDRGALKERFIKVRGKR